jgi:hypothetical protein
MLLLKNVAMVMTRSMNREMLCRPAVMIDTEFTQFQPAVRSRQINLAALGHKMTTVPITAK